MRDHHLRQLSRLPAPITVCMVHLRAVGTHLRSGRPVFQNDPRMLSRQKLIFLRFLSGAEHWRPQYTPRQAVCKLSARRAAEETLERLRSHANDAKAASYQRYFKEPVNYYGLDTESARDITKDLFDRVQESWTIEDAVRFCKAMVEDPPNERALRHRASARDLGCRGRVPRPGNGRTADRHQGRHRSHPAPNINRQRRLELEPCLNTQS